MFFLSDEMPFSFDEMLLFGAASGEKLVEDTATGNPLTFLTDVSKPLKSLTVPFLPVQSGTGDPSPSNVRNIVPLNGLTVWQSIETGTFVQGGIADATGGNSTSDQRIRTDYLPVSTLSEDDNTFELYGIGYAENEPVLRMVHFYDSNKTWIQGNDSVRNKHSAIIRKSYIPNNAVYFRASVQMSNTSENITPDGVALFVNKKAVYPVSFPSPVYGGILYMDSGVLRITWAGFAATWADGESETDMGSGITRKVFPMVDYLQTGQANNMCNIAPYQASESASIHFYYSGSGTTNRKCRLFLPSDTPDSTEITVITKLSQAQTVQLTPEQITALVGNNTLWSDSNGEMTAVFFKKA